MPRITYEFAEDQIERDYGEFDHPLDELQSLTTYFPAKTLFRVYLDTAPVEYAFMGRDGICFPLYKAINAYRNPKQYSSVPVLMEDVGCRREIIYAFFLKFVLSKYGSHPNIEFTYDFMLGKHNIDDVKRFIFHLRSRNDKETEILGVSWVIRALESCIADLPDNMRERASSLINYFMQNMNTAYRLILREEMEAKFKALSLSDWLEMIS